MKRWLDQVYWHNSIQDYLIAIGIVIAGFIILRLFRTIVLQRVRRWADKSHTHVDDFLLKTVQKALLPLLYVLLLYAAIRSLTLSEAFLHTLKSVMAVVLTFFVIRLLTTTLEYVLVSFLKRRGTGSERKTEVHGILLVINIVIWCVGLIFLLDNLGFNVATVITGFGIGGVAVALAAQAVLGDFFAYFVIFFDRPFEIGDFLIVDEKLGTVEYIGIKTTRLRSLSGEQIIFSNKHLTDSRVHNYKQMQKRRIVFGLNVSYDTPAEKLEMIPDMIKGFIEAQGQVGFDRGHFASFMNTGLYFEFVYYVLSSDYTLYMNIQQGVNLAIYQEFKRQGIIFSFPTQTVHLHKNGDANTNAAVSAKG